MPVPAGGSDYLPIAALAISLVSFVVSAATLYFSHMRRARISVQVGPKFKIYYLKGKALSFYFPVTFFNRAQKIGAISSLELILVAPDGREFHFPWRSFSEYESATDSWKYRDLVHTIAVPGASTVQKMIWFSWPMDSATQPIVPIGVNECRFRYKALASGKIKEIKESFLMNETAASRLESYRAEGKSTTMDFDIGLHPDLHEIVNADGSNEMA